MADFHPCVVEEQRSKLSDWVTLVERAVQFSEGDQSHKYHSLDQPDYVTVPRG